MERAELKYWKTELMWTPLLSCSFKTKNGLRLQKNLGLVLGEIQAIELVSSEKNIFLDKKKQLSK